MTTVTNPVLPIPEDTIQGTGSYTVPANKYGFLSASASSSAAGTHSIGRNDISPSGGSGSASSAQNNLWLASGNSISTDSNVVSATLGSTGGQIGLNGFAEIRVNGTRVCRANSTARAGTCTASSSFATISGSSTAEWSIALYPIPKNNLPLNLIEGN